MLLPTVLLLSVACRPVETKPSSVICGSGFVLDGSDCVPEPCGAGRWGNLPVDDETVYVDGSAGEGGDGTEELPYTTIQSGLDRAGALEGGLVAVAAGVYPETLLFSPDHGDVHLAGRCREMVTLDASVGKGKMPGIGIDAAYAKVEVSGLTVRDSSIAGLWMLSGDVVMRDGAIMGSTYYGVIVSHPGNTIDNLLLEGCLVVGNIDGGMLVVDPGTQVTLRNTTVGDTQPNASGQFGRGIEVNMGAVLSAEGCIIDGNTEIGVLASDPDTRVTLRDTAVRGTQPDANGTGGLGIEVSDGAFLSAEGGLVDRNTTIGLLVASPDTRVVLRDTTVKAMQGRGIEVRDGATLIAEGSLIDGNTVVGLIASDSGTQVSLEDTMVRDTQPNTDGEFGRGVDVNEGATLTAEGCVIDGNTGMGLLAADPGTRVVLRNTTVKNTLPEANGESGSGIGVQDGAILSTEGCFIDGNTSEGMFIIHSGTQVFLVDTIIRDTHPNGNGKFGRGAEIAYGAVLSMKGCLVDGNTSEGLFISTPGTRALLVDTTISGTQPDPSGEFGRGIAVNDGAFLSVVGCVIDRNTDEGLLAGDPGTLITLQDTTISGTVPGFNLTASIASGAAVQEGAFLSATNLIVVSNQGPGLIVNGKGAALECSGCLIEDNQFAGATVIRGGGLSISDSIIEGTTAAANLLGGAGVYAWPWAGDPPAVTLMNTVIRDNPIAGVWLIENGSYVLTGNTISGSIGEAFGSGSRCGDAVLALQGVSAWDGVSGLLLQDNHIENASGAGIFLDASSALISGNTFSGNAVDLVVQNQSCDPLQTSYLEVPHRVLCPDYSYPTCFNEFLYEAKPADPVVWEGIHQSSMCGSIDDVRTTWMVDRCSFPPSSSYP